MVQLFGGWGFKAENLTSLGIHTRHDMLYGAVLAGGVHGLENDEQGISVVRVQHILIGGKVLYIIHELLLSILPGFKFPGVGGVEVVKLEFLP